MRFDNKLEHYHGTDTNPIFQGNTSWTQLGEIGYRVNQMADLQKLLPSIPRSKFGNYTFGALQNNRQPFMVMKVRLKTVKNTKYPNKFYLYSDPTNHFNRYEYFEDADMTLASHEMELIQVTDTTDLANYINISPNNNAYMGVADYFGTGHPEFVVANELPVIAPMAMGQLQHAHLGRDYNRPMYHPDTIADRKALNKPVWEKSYFSSGNYSYFEPDTSWEATHRKRPVYNYPIGNGYGHPLMPKDQVKVEMSSTIKSFPQWAPTATNTRKTFGLDHCYYLNNIFWDEYFFSSIAPHEVKTDLVNPTKDPIASGEVVYKDKRTMLDVFSDFVNKEQDLPNARMQLYLPKGETLDDAAKILF